MDYLYRADAGKPAPEFRDALRILSRPEPAFELGPNPLGLSDEMIAKIAEWNKRQRQKEADRAAA